MDQIQAKGIVRVVGADELEQAVSEGWVLESSFTEDKLVPVYEDKPNPKYRITDEQGYYDNGQPQFINVPTGLVAQRVTKFILSMDSESAQGKLVEEVTALKKQIEALEDTIKKEREGANRARLEVGKELGASRDTLTKLQADYQKVVTERDLARNQAAELKTSNQRIRDFATVLWSEVGNERMRQVLGSRYPAELDDQTIPVQMAKNLFDHLLEE